VPCVQVRTQVYKLHSWKRKRRVDRPVEKVKTGTGSLTVQYQGGIITVNVFLPEAAQVYCQCLAKSITGIGGSVALSASNNGIVRCRHLAVFSLLPNFSQPIHWVMHHFALAHDTSAPHLHVGVNVAVNRQVVAGVDAGIEHKAALYVGPPPA